MSKTEPLRLGRVPKSLRSHAAEAFAKGRRHRLFRHRRQRGKHGAALRERAPVPRSGPVRGGAALRLPGDAHEQLGLDAQRLGRAISGSRTARSSALPATSCRPATRLVGRRMDSHSRTRTASRSTSTICVRATSSRRSNGPRSRARCACTTYATASRPLRSRPAPTRAP